MLQFHSDYAQLYASFRWAIPPRYNMGVDVCDRWAAAAPERPAILDVSAAGAVKALTFGVFRDQSNRLANALRHFGVWRGDRVAILLPQMAEVAIGHVATYKLGAIALPLAVVFGPDALLYRLQDAGVSALITNAASLAKIAQIRAQLPELKLVVSVDGAGESALGWQDLLSKASANFIAEDTSADDPALMIYTSGTTGPPKGALHAHRVLLGHLPGVQFSHEFLPQPGDLAWTPADWAWAGGLLNMLLPSLHFGLTVVARKFEKFDPEAALRLMADHAIRNIFVPPTALRMMRAVPDIRQRYDLKLRTLAAAGESLGAETYAWGRTAFGLTINEAYGQTECNLVLGSCAVIGVSKPGAIGKPVPGHDAAVIRKDGTRCAPGEAGEIAIRAPNPVMFLSYWNNPQATHAKYRGDWLLTGDQGVMDEEGYVTFFGRDDDVITSSGYRIGPGEIEDCLLRHPAVALAAAVGKPDPLRGELVKAFVVLKPNVPESAELAAEIQSFVRKHLSAHEYPREIAFVTELPLTTTGKIIRRLLREQV
ncbi:acyl-CoA synthetase [Methylovirgula sp. 4M-Z18]|uniref:acyl-CoA synthetase n=1 Tax=Methylovirgula sp. 4M-Z18 TaxID=2293567 RepID=UPI000E2E6401|nr:acyl-CoA synthetase [Methylovirgula sp. 4M-Z18]RFB78224.1 AMP-dependent synthetase [Methylovirgula sp. 4M-Z18]